MSALFALVVAAAGCPEALARADALASRELAGRAEEIVATIDASGAGPTGALARAARALASAEGSPSGLDAAAASFRTALGRHCALAALPVGPDPSPRDREALAEVLARPELAHARPDLWAIRRALDRIWDWIVDLLGTAEAERYASVGRALFVGAAAGATVLLLSALRRRVARPSRPRASAPADPGAARPAPDASAAHAEEALRRGDGRAAVRFALLSALGALEQAGRVPRGRTLTNGELVAAATASAPREPAEGRTGAGSLPADLEVLARAFDRAIYGGAPVAPDDARAALERARRVVASARPGRGEGARAGGAR